MVRAGGSVNAPDMNLLLTLAGACDLVGALHPHERVHLHAESLLDAQAMSPERSALPLSKLESAGRETYSSRRRAGASLSSPAVHQTSTIVFALCHQCRLIRGTEIIPPYPASRRIKSSSGTKLNDLHKYCGMVGRQHSGMATLAIRRASGSLVNVRTA
jgi:hypothetical protein